MLRVFTLVGLIGLTTVFAISCKPSFRYRTGNENTLGLTLEEQKRWWADPLMPAPGKSTDGPTGPLAEWAKPKK